MAPDIDLDDPRLKAAFAAFLLESEKDTPQNKAFDAAFKLLPNERHTGLRYKIAFEWPTSPEVILEIEKLKKESPKAKGLPSKEDIIRQMWTLTQDDRTPHKDRVAMARLIADMCGHIKNSGDDEESKRMPSAPTYKIVNA